MEQQPHTPQIYDYRQHDRIWQRVAPNLEPYPALRQSSEQPETALSPTPPPAQTLLPGATPDPCCMGTAASEMLDVLTGFAQEAFSDRRLFLTAARHGPISARPVMRELAESETTHARRIMAVYYLITGHCYHPLPPRPSARIENWCSFLRECYHREACTGLNYRRAADGTSDPCLSQILDQLSNESYQRAQTLLQLLEQGLRC